VGAIVKEDGIVIVEHARRSQPPDATTGLRRTREVRSGDSSLSIYGCQR